MAPHFLADSKLFVVLQLRIINYGITDTSFILSLLGRREMQYPSDSNSKFYTHTPPSLLNKTLSESIVKSFSVSQWVGKMCGLKETFFLHISSMEYIT